MGRKAGSLVRCTCYECGATELRRGCNARFLCRQCDPNPRADSVQYQAHHAVAVAIRNGSLARPADFACVDCGKPAIEYDHRDYSKPLQVDPVCRRCNLLRGHAVGHITPRTIKRLAASRTPA